MFACCLVTLGHGEAAQPFGHQTSSLASLLDRYRHTDADAAVAEFARWDPNRIEAEVTLPPANEDAWMQAARVIFNVETDLQAGTLFAARPAGEGFQARTRVSLAIAARLIPQARTAGDARLLEFCRRVMVTIGSAARRLNRMPGTFPSDALRQWFPQDAELLLLASSEAEADMGPDTGRGSMNRFLPPPIDSLKGGDFSRPLAHDAEGFARDALKQHPELAEARLHLGRILMVFSRDREAQTELERAARDATGDTTPFVGYLAAMFLGRIQEDRGRADLARPLYERAASLSPRAPSAPLALGALDLTEGRHGDARATVAAIFGTVDQPHDADIDPIDLYPAPFYWQIDARIRVLREAVRQ